MVIAINERRKLLIVGTYFVRIVTATRHNSVSLVEIPRLGVITAIAAVSAQITARHYLLGRDFKFLLSSRVDANPIAYGGRHGNSVARLTVALVLYLPDGRAFVPFRSGVKALRQVQSIPKFLDVVFPKD